MEKVYEFWYNSCTLVGEKASISLHKTLKGAEKALEWHRNEKYKEWREHDAWQREEYGKEYERVKRDFAENEVWGVSPRKIED